MISQVQVANGKKENLVVCKKKISVPFCSNESELFIIIIKVSKTEKLNGFFSKDENGQKRVSKGQVWSNLGQGKGLVCHNNVPNYKYD